MTGHASKFKGEKIMMSEHKISTRFVTSGKRPVIVVRSGDRKAQYPAPYSTTKSHADAVRKFVTKAYGKGATMIKTEDGPQGDRYTVMAPEAEKTEG
jgi:hypothetical protein